MDAKFALDVRYYRLSEALQPYFTALYAFDFRCAPGELVRDCLHPEWSQMRFMLGPPPLASVADGPFVEQAAFAAVGPTSRSIEFGLRTSKGWGIGLLPAGWAKFAAGPAQALADRSVDGTRHPAFAVFAPIQPLVEDGGGDLDAVARRINGYLMEQLDRPMKQEKLVFACQEILRDPEVASVTELCERLGLATRSLERLCARYFGFPPKLLLRRQRFLRSLAEFMLNTRRKWSTAIDGQYYDQAQFVRDFRSFMGMTPSEYAAMPHPILDRMMAQGLADARVAPQTDLPTVLRYGRRGAGAD